MNVARKLVSLLVLFLTLSTASSAQLARQWVARFAGNGKNGSNVATAMTVDDSGNVYVTGWASRKISGVDIVTIKYAADGTQRWAQYYAAPGTGDDKGKAIAVDTAYNVYVTGASNGGGSGLDYVTIKYKADGSDTLWARRYNGPGNGEDQPSAIAVNDSLNVYVTGWSMGSGTGLDYATLKYDVAGNLKWVQRYNGPLGNGVDSALAMALRGTTDLYVTGTSVDSGYDYETVKYDPASGDTVWTARYNGSGFGKDIARAIVLRGSSDVYITGGSQNAAGNFDYLTIKYNSSGVQQWASRYDGSAGGEDQAYAIGVFSTNRVYVTGKSLQTGNFNDIVTVKYNESGGVEGWASIYNGPGNDEDFGVAVTGGSSPYVLGASTGAGTGLDYVLIQYNGGNGNENFDLRYNGPANDVDIPMAMATFGNSVYVTGTSKSQAKGTDILTICYTDPHHMRYRTFTQDSLIVKATNTKTGALPNAGNVRDQAFTMAYPKIKKGFAGYPGGLVVGNARPDSAKSFGWMRFDKGKGVATYLPATGPARGFDVYGMSIFFGEKRNPKRDKFNDHLVGELLALRMNIGASDAELLPPTFGDLTYNDGDTSNHFNGLTLRQLATTIDNDLTYWRYYPEINWPLLDSIVSRVNRAFVGPVHVVSINPPVLTGAVLIDSVSFLQPGVAPLANPLSFPAGSIAGLPQRYELYQNYPNPFNPQTTIEFDLPQASMVTLKIYDILGREVATLLNEEPMEDGNQEVVFDGQALSSGVYFYRLVANHGEFQQVKKMMLIK